MKGQSRKRLLFDQKQPSLAWELFEGTVNLLVYAIILCVALAAIVVLSF